MKTGFLIVVFLASALQATIEISAKNTEAFFSMIQYDAYQQIQQFFEGVHRKYGEETVLAYANLRNAENQTPLHLAQGPEMFRILLRNGADLSAIDSQNRLPLVAICLNNEPDTSQSILQSAAQLSLELANNVQRDRSITHGQI